MTSGSFGESLGVQHHPTVQLDAPHFSLKTLWSLMLCLVNRWNPADLDGFRSIPITGKDQVLLYPVFFRPICWMATERSSDGEIPWFSTCSRPSNLEALPLPLSWTRELIRFSRNNKGAKICVEFSSIPFGGCVFFCFYFGARNLWKNTARAMF